MKDYSQNGEQAIILDAIDRIKPELKQSVEFGGADGYYCSNTAALRELGWKVWMCDLREYPPHVFAREVTPSVVNDILPPCSVLSIDIDGNDYNVWKAYTSKPDIVIIEVNSSIHPLSPSPISDPEKGTGYMPMVLLGIEKGYFLLCHTGNLIFIRNEHRALFPEVVGDGVSNWEEYFKTDWV